MNWLKSSLFGFFPIPYEVKRYPLTPKIHRLHIIYILLLTVFISLIAFFGLYRTFITELFPRAIFFSLSNDIVFLLLVCTTMVSFFVCLCFICAQHHFFSRYLPILLLGLFYLGNISLNSLVSGFFTMDTFHFLFSKDKVVSLEQKSALSSFFLTIIYRCLLVLAFLFFSRNYWKRIFKQFRDNPAIFFAYFTILIGVYLVNLNFFTLSRGGLAGNSQNQNDLINLFRSGSTFLRLFFLINTVLIAPFWEEIIWRYLPGEMFGRNRHIFLMFFFAIVWFALAHIRYADLNIKPGSFSVLLFLKGLFQTQLLSYWYFSMMFITLYWLTNYSLPYTIVFHMLHNLYVFYVVF